MANLLNPITRAYLDFDSGLHLEEAPSQEKALEATMATVPAAYKAILSPHRRLILLALLLLAHPPLGTTLSAQTRTQAFTITEGKDPITDADRTTLSTREVRSSALRAGTLAWRCHGTEIEVFLLADEFLDIRTSVWVQWRFDDKPASPGDYWEVSTRGTGVFVPKAHIWAFTESAKGAAKVVVRARDYRGTFHDYEFSLMGLTAGLARLGCSLPPPPATTPTSLRAAVAPTIRVGREGGRNSLWIESNERASVGGTAANLRWSCGPEDVEVSFALEMLAEASRIVRATIETDFDRESIVDGFWGPVRAGASSVVPDLVAEFTRHALGSGTVVLRFVRGTEALDAYTFRLEGLQEALEGIGCPVR